MTDSTHKCPAPDCTKRVPFDQLACLAHWFAIPKPLRDEVWRAYRGPGPGSVAHLAAIGAAIDFLRRDHADAR
jgi:hypothetical protein